VNTSSQGRTDAGRSTAVATTLVILASTPLFGPPRRCALARQNKAAEGRGAPGVAERRGVRVVVAGATLEVVTTGSDDASFPRRTVDTRTVVRRQSGSARQDGVEIETMIACRFDAIDSAGVRSVT